MVVGEIVIDGYAIRVCYFNVISVAFTPPALISAASKTANFNFFIKILVLNLLINSFNL